MEALEDVASCLESWSPLHKRVEVLDCYPDGRAHHVKTTIKIMGLVDKEILEYHWGPDWVVWDAKDTSQQHGQHVEYNLKPEGVDKTRVRFDITVEPAGPIPAFIVRRAMQDRARRRDKGCGQVLREKRAVANGAEPMRDAERGKAAKPYTRFNVSRSEALATGLRSNL